MRNRGIFLYLSFFFSLAGGASAQTTDSIHPGPSYSQSLDATQPNSAAPANLDSQNDWQTTWYPFYVFGMSANGTVGIGGLRTPVDASLGDILGKTNFIYEGAVDVRKRRFGLLTDVNYLNLGSSQTFESPSLFGGTNVDAQLFVFDPEFYVRAVGTERASLDLMVGLRYWHLSDEIEFLPGRAAGRTLNGGDDWVDPVLGGRILLHLDDANKWAFPIKGDVGGFGAGSELTWQVLGGMSCTFKDRYRVVLGYRALAVDRRKGDSILDLTFNGPMMGFAIDFRGSK
jgi:hypothetical protein